GSGPRAFDRDAYLQADKFERVAFAKINAGKSRPAAVLTPDLGLNLLGGVGLRAVLCVSFSIGELLFGFFQCLHLIQIFSGAIEFSRLASFDVKAINLLVLFTLLILIFAAGNNGSKLLQRSCGHRLRVSFFFPAKNTVARIRLWAAGTSAHESRL